MSLLGGWDARIAQSQEVQDKVDCRRVHAAPPDLPRLASEVQVVTDQAGAESLLRALEAAPLAAIAVDSEYQFDQDGVELRSGKTWYDIRSIQPICFSIAAWVRDGPEDGAGYMLTAVLDVRQEGVAEVLARILRLRVPFVFHHIKAELHALWALGLDPHLHQVYDTFLAGACLQLGRHHKKSLRSGDGNLAEEIRGQAELARTKTHSLSLVGQCRKHGLDYPHSDSKDDLRGQFMSLASEAKMTSAMVQYAAADAEWTLRLYVAQQTEVLMAGLASHLHTVEFPFAVANARMEWRGVHVDPEQRRRVVEGVRQASEHYAGELRGHGVANPASSQQFLAAMRKAGLANRFVRYGRPCTDDKLLEKFSKLHPAIAALRQYRRYSRQAGEEWLTGVLDGTDGRVHPNHYQLGTATGRNTCSQPNLPGISQVIRPTVTAPPGRALIDLDYSQIEVGIAAAEYDDPDLLAAFHAGDVYAAMAQRFFADQLSEEERSLDAVEFKKRQPDLRNRIKVFVLAVIYNMQAPAIASRFELDLESAERERQRFLGLFPALERRLDEVVAAGVSRGYAVMVSGLRRLLEPGARRDSWVQNLLRNTPIQGSETVVFKEAIVQLDRVFRGTSAWLVLPVYDAVVIECDLCDLQRVRQRAVQVMEDAVRRFYPNLKPRVDINDADPSCWNKDGRADSLDRFLEDPTYRVGAAAAATEEEPVPEWFGADEGCPAPALDAPLESAFQDLLREVPPAATEAVDLDAWRERYRERAAIREYEGGQDRPQAEAEARAEVLQALGELLGVETDTAGAGGGCHAL